MARGDEDHEPESRIRQALSAPFAGLRAVADALPARSAVLTDVLSGKIASPSRPLLPPEWYDGILGGWPERFRRLAAGLLLGRSRARMQAMDGILGEIWKGRVVRSVRDLEPPGPFGFAAVLAAADDPAALPMWEALGPLAGEATAADVLLVAGRVEESWLAARAEEADASSFGAFGATCLAAASLLAGRLDRPWPERDLSRAVLDADWLRGLRREAARADAEARLDSGVAATCLPPGLRWRCGEGVPAPPPGLLAMALEWMEVLVRRRPGPGLTDLLEEIEDLVAPTSERALGEWAEDLAERAIAAAEEGRE